MSTIVLHTPRAVTGATVRPAAPSFWSRLLAAIEANGQRRAAAELRRYAAHQVDRDPEFARELYAAAAFAERA
jgi:hypothetical protein